VSHVEENNRRTGPTYLAKFGKVPVTYSGLLDYGNLVVESIVEHLKPLSERIDALEKAADLDVDVVDDGAEFIVRVVRGQTIKDFRLAKPTLADCYRGVWQPGEHKRGDTVTWSGSLWLCLRNTSGKPEVSDNWKLITKRGRSGKDAP
jgi:hypothetical protein